MSNEPSRRRWTHIFKPDARAEVEDELAFHLERRVQENIARGMEPEAARAAAEQRLGDLRIVRHECAALLKAERRSEARRDWMKLSWLDFKLGLRLLVRYPGLTLVGGLAMAFAIAVGAGGFEVVKQMVDPRLPLDEGDRIVAIQNFHTRIGESLGQSLQDFTLWRDVVKSVDDLGAFRTIERNLTLGVSQAEPVSIAEISASAFRVARVRPLLGRTLIESDEHAGAAPVVVLGYDVWQTRLAGDPNVVGRVVRLGGTPTTIVGVMPDGFTFPVAHKLWIPLRVNAVDYALHRGPGIKVFGRLARGVSRERAQAELTTIGTRVAAAYPETHRDLTPEVVPYTRAILPLDVPHGLEPVVYAINLFFVMLLVLICANVALLMFARAAARESEIVVRNALGASRSRIITQLFAEALVLGAAAAVIGLAAARVALRAWPGVIQLESDGGTPFWFDDSIGPTTFLYTALLTILTAAIVGVVPALKMTGRRVEAHLRQRAAGGGGLHFGRVWTAVIIAQIAFTVTFPATAFFARRHVAGFESLDVGFPAREYLSVQLELDRTAMDTDAQFRAKMRATSRELERRLIAEPAIAGVTFANRLPRTYHPQRWVETDSGGAAVPPSSRGHPVTNATVDLDYFDVMGAPILAGRGFHSGDLKDDTRVVVVNQSFVDRVLGGRNPIGRRVRYDGDGPRPWYEVVGVVKDLGMVAEDPRNGAGLYQPAAAADAPPMHMAMHVRGDAGSFAARLRTIAAGVDPTLRLHQILPLDAVGSSRGLEVNFLFKLLVGLSPIALLLSLAGIYAVTSFAVARRTREIGIRVALGADPRRVIAAIFARPLTQVAIGIMAGGWMTGMLTYGIMRDALWPKGVTVVALYAFLMMGVCMLSCIVPTRRALRIQPTSALKAE
jgi:putative ABC transport system permease protein